MNWLVEFLQSLFNATFDYVLLPISGSANTIFSIIIMFGLAYWTFYWQPKYNKQAESDADQLL